MDWLQIIADAENVPYRLGEHDCLNVACAVVQARTGIDYWPQFAGYKTKRQALVTIARIAPTLRGAVSKVLSTPELPPRMAQRGDLVLYRDTDEHIGICLGRDVAVLGADGLQRISIMSDALVAAWRVKCPPQ